MPRCCARREERGLDAVVPLVVAPGHPDQLSFFFRLDGKVTHERAEVEKVGFLPDDGHFFNGALIRSDVFFKVGLPDMRLFIRGDEVDFTLRLRKAGDPLRHGDHRCHHATRTPSPKPSTSSVRGGT